MVPRLNLTVKSGVLFFVTFVFNIRIIGMSTYSIVMGLIASHTVLFYLGLKLGELLFSNQEQRLTYSVDITLREPHEDIHDFIARSYREGLGRYRIV